MLISIEVNGRQREVEVEDSAVLADVLREQCGQKSVHLGCEHGICGACNVSVDGEVVRACMVLAASTDGSKVTTFEGLTDDLAQHIKEAFHQRHALQCGFCTPGLIVTIHDFLSIDSCPDVEEARRRISGNICRCTGYQAIVETIQNVGTTSRAMIDSAKESMRNDFSE